MATDLHKDTYYRNAKPGDKPYLILDGGGLYLRVGATGTKSWQFRYRHDGKEQVYTVGKYPAISLGEARKKAQEARERAAEGEHLTRHKHVAKAKKAAAASSTFAALAEAWLRAEARRKKWTSDYVVEATRSVQNHLGSLGNLPVTEITAAIVSPVLQKIERAAPAMEEKVHRRLNAIMDYAVEVGALVQNPLPRRRARKSQSKHFPAVVDLPGVGAILRAAAAADPCKAIQRAHLLLVFTGQRIGEVVGARWDEFELDAASWERRAQEILRVNSVDDAGTADMQRAFDIGNGGWVIPRSRMKIKDEARGPHLIPLPDGLIAGLKYWKAVDNDTSLFICPAPRNPEKAITPEACEKHYREVLGLGGKHSPHSWRSAFKTICKDAGKDWESIERQVDHIVESKTEAAYDRSKRLVSRRELLQWYEDTLVAARDGAAVIPMRKKI